jgi:hypothetical protein
MAAATDRMTPCRHPEAARLQVAYPVAADAVIWKGAMVMLVAGYAVPAADTAGGIVVGVAEHSMDNTGGDDGDIDVVCASGNAFRFVGSGIVAADVGKPAYVADDITVADATGTNGVVAGVIEELESANVVWVYIPPTNALALTGVLAAAVAAAAAAPVAVMQHAIVAGDITAEEYVFTFPFTVGAWSVTFRSATGLALAATNLVTSTGATVTVALDAAGAPKLIATDVVAVTASA